MPKVVFEKVDGNLGSKVTEFVHKNYPKLKDKELIIGVNGNVVKVLEHKDLSPLFLSLSIFQ
jgi:hypothetical protein